MAGTGTRGGRGHRSRRPFRALQVGWRPYPPPLPPSYTVCAAEGCHGDADRNAPARCFLVNIGEATLAYGDSPAATLRSEPALAFEDENLALEGARGQRIPLEGSLLTLKRAVMEMEGLAALAEALPGDIPALALVDGPLLPWGRAPS